MRFFLPAMALLFAAPSFAGASAAKISLPPELMFKGKPVEPMCFDSLAGFGQAPKEINIANCISTEYTPEALEMRENGAIGYSFGEAGFNGKPYVYYRYLGMSHDMPTLLVTSSGGGSGIFDTLIRVKREGDVLKTGDILGGGDRCNGGIEATDIKNNQLSYERWITPADILRLADGDDDHLESSAASCFALAQYTEGKLTGVKLEISSGANPKDSKGWTERFPRQSCFNGLYREQVAKGKTSFDMDGLKAFAGEYAKRCGNINPPKNK